MDIRQATVERADGGGGMEGGDMTMANVVASAEDFNTRYGSLVGFQEAVRRVKPIPRAAAQFDLSLAVASSGAKTAADAVDHLSLRLLRVPVDAEVRAALIVFLEQQLGTADLDHAGRLFGAAAAARRAPDHEHTRIPALLRRRLGPNFWRRPWRFSLASAASHGAIFCGPASAA